jgi:c-di-GMP-binding flagellar brake protein YcgR
MANADRRQFPRLALNVPFTLVIPGRDRPLRGQLRDISQGGCFFTAGPSAEPEVKPQGRVSMDFVVLPRSICNATGRVVRGGANGANGDGGATGAGYGVEFGAVNAELQRFVDELEAASPSERAEYLSRILDPEIYLA